MIPQDDIRVGDAERDAVMVALHEHFAEGRLDRGELDERLGTVLSARTRGDLRTVVRDLPGPSGLPEAELGPALRGGGVAGGPEAGFSHGPWVPGPALMFGGPGHHGALRHHRHAHRHMHRHMHGHMGRGHRHGPPFPAFPLLLAVFLVAAFTIGPGAGFLAVLQVALVIWVIRAALVAFGVRRSRRHRHLTPGA
ncbi:DUF1707 SHOCT-like domain-containing protein [Actinomadura roseirufa]|uniref:DUF1707 SHOCT-like domain-containing protein n=1 Tax=Actinomadura roseirufa TaxID=2094049 RepID=UPI0010415AA6|nr:DUF1707 domain-containing protein [Actinomadura roseirufa]